MKDGHEKQEEEVYGEKDMFIDENEKERKEVRFGPKSRRVGVSIPAEHPGGIGRASWRDRSIIKASRSSASRYPRGP